MSWIPPLIVLNLMLLIVLIFILFLLHSTNIRVKSHAQALYEITETATDAIYDRMRMGRQAHHPLDQVYIPNAGGYVQLWVIAKRSLGYNDEELAELIQSIDAQKLLKMDIEEEADHE